MLSFYDTKLLSNVSSYIQFTFSEIGIQKPRFLVTEHFKTEVLLISVKLNVFGLRDFF